MSNHTSGQNVRKLKLGVAGLGRAFTLMLPTFLLDERIQLVAAADPRKDARCQFEADFGGKSYDTVEQLVADDDVEAIYISTPHQMHAKHTALAASHGKHVLVEKPMALTLDECRSMIDCCSKAGVRLIVGHCHSFDTPILKAREFIETGAVGQVRMIHAMNYTDFLFRPRRPEELNTSEGGGVIYSQAAHQIDVVRLLAASPVVSVRAEVGAWDASRPTEGAYSCLLWFKNGAFATVTYSGYAHFDSDEFFGWIDEMGQDKDPDSYGVARRRLSELTSADEEAKIKNAGTYGGPTYVRPHLDSWAMSRNHHQHFGPITVSCDEADIRPSPDAVLIYGNTNRTRIQLERPHVPRIEVIDELYDAVVNSLSPIHDGEWAMSTLKVCLALLESASSRQEVIIQ